MNYARLQGEGGRNEKAVISDVQKGEADERGWRAAAALADGCRSAEVRVTPACGGARRTVAVHAMTSFPLRVAAAAVSLSRPLTPDRCLPACSTPPASLSIPLLYHHLSLPAQLFP